MWLLDTKTLKLEEFIGDPPPYAILSHRWEEHQELSFGDVAFSSAHLNGYAKIQGFCLKAHQAGFFYGWVDTCCIDKKSSAEVSEAINSMFAWYRDAAICFVYLADVGGVRELGQSSWFTRGWTLQELLAPIEIQFFDKDWKLLGRKRDLAADISHITGVPERALDCFRPNDYCIAYKMSWAAQRRTTRKEDRAYSLLGLFDINIPLVYGEGDKAFQRLQEEIMKTSNDASIFFWQGRASGLSSMLAQDPSCFSNIDSSVDEPIERFRLPSGWRLTNAGLSIPQARLRPYLRSAKGAEIYLLQIMTDFLLVSDDPLGVYPQVVEFTGGNEPALGVLIIKEFGDTWRRVEVNGQTSVVDRRRFMDIANEKQDVNISHASLLLYEMSEDQVLPLTIKVRGKLDGMVITSYLRPCRNDPAGLPDWPETKMQLRDFELICSLASHSQQLYGVLAYVKIDITSDTSMVIYLCFNSMFQPFLFMYAGSHRLKSRTFKDSDIFDAYQRVLMEGQSSLLDGRPLGISFDKITRAWLKQGSRGSAQLDFKGLSAVAELHSDYMNFDIYISKKSLLYESAMRAPLPTPGIVGTDRGTGPFKSR